VIRYLLLATLVAASACTAVTLPGPDDSDTRPVATDSALYHLRRADGVYEASAVATYVNRTGAPVHYARCSRDHRGPMHRLRRTGPDSTRRAFIGAVWACVGGVPSGVLGPGDTVSASVWLGSTESPSANPPIAAEQRVGRFRIELLLCEAPVTDSDRCRLLPQMRRESNAFTVGY
jgi:hypothetical protein